MPTYTHRTNARVSLFSFIRNNHNPCFVVIGVVARRRCLPLSPETKSLAHLTMFSSYSPPYTCTRACSQRILLADHDRRFYAYQITRDVCRVHPVGAGPDAKWQQTTTSHARIKNRLIICKFHFTDERLVAKWYGIKYRKFPIHIVWASSRALLVQVLQRSL